ncbi:MAG: hypothetical protein ACI4UN_08070 [Muribaculaceae bacterium]
MICTFAAITAGLWLLLRAYIMLARRFGITNETSDVVTGGGIIIPLAYLGADLFAAHSCVLYPYFFVGMAIIATISFIDDIHDVSPLLRLAVHFICAVLLLMQFQANAPSIDMPWWLCTIVVVGIVALTNAFNFIDGIKGITGCYALAVLLPYFFTFIPVNETVYMCITAAVIAFCCFNFRTPERCYCGDTGSISLGYFLAFVILSQSAYAPYMSQSALSLSGIDPTVIIFVIVYLTDFALTLCKRILRRENILNSHRSHLFQRLAFEVGVPHMHIAISYAAVQVAISAVYILAPESLHLPVLIVSALALAGAYVAISHRIDAASQPPQ